MMPGIAEDGCPCFTATVELDDSEVGKRFRWGVRLDGPFTNVWGIPTEVNDSVSSDRYRIFELKPAGSTQREEPILPTRGVSARESFSLSRQSRNQTGG
jgi:1,4-alpha-glucan branching enzyme